MIQHMRVLIVEDNEDDVALLQLALRRGGYEITCAVVETPSAMRLALQSQEWDIITSDHAMPQFSAPAALMLAKELRPDVPFIIVSGEIDLNLAVSLMKGGAQDYIQKRELVRVVPAIERELREVELRRDRQRADAALIESELKYRSLIDSSSDPIFCVDEKGQYHFTNTIFAETFGKTPDFFIGKTFWDIYPKEHADIRYATTQRVFQTGKSESLEVAVPLPDKTLYFYATANPVKDETGKVILSLTHATDITKRKQAEDLLAQTRLNYEAFFNTIDEFLFVLDEQGNIIHTNTTVIDRLGYTREDLTGKSVLMIHPPERRAEAGRIVGEMLNGEAEFCPVPIITKSGVQIPVETRVSHGFWDGKPVIFGVTKDISKIKLSEEKFSKIFALNPSACGLSNLDDRQYIEVNEAFYTLFGFDKNEVIGKTAYDLGIIPFETASSILRQADSDGNVTNAEAELKAKNGDIKHVLLSAENIYVQDKTYRFTVVHDITERRFAEDALRAERNSLKQMVGFTEELLKTGSEQVTYQKILENLLWISGAKYGVFTLLNESTGKFTTVAVAGLNDPLKQAAKILGFELVGKEWNEYATENEKLKDKVVSLFPSISELAGRVIPEIITRPIEKLINIGEVAVTKVMVNHQMIGDFTLIMPAGKHFENDALIEIYSKQIDIFITRTKAEGKLKESEEKYRVLFTNEIYAICIFDLETQKLLDVNDAYSSLYGYSREELTSGMTIHDITAEHQKSDLAAVQAKREGTIFIPLRYHRKKDGTVFPVEIVGGPYEWKGRKVMFAMANDISVRQQAEEQLHTASRQLLNVMDSSGDIIAMMDTEYRYILFNTAFHDEFKRIYGQDLKMGDSMPQALAHLPNDLANAMQYWNRALAGENFTITQQFGDIQRERNWYELRYNPIRNSEGKLAGAMHSVRNVTERKRAEEALQQRERDFSTLVENAPDMIVRFDTSLRHVYCNQAVERQLGVPVNTIIGKTPFECGIPPENAEFIENALKNVLETGTELEVEQIYPTPSGLKTYQTRIAPEYDSQGRSASLLAISRDITERKHAEKALRESLERNRTILQTAMDGFWLADMQGRLLEVNEAYCRMSGYTSNELLCMCISDLEVVEKNDDTAAHIQKIMAQGEDRFESRHRGKDGRIFDVEVSVQYQANPGGQMEAFLRDITERKRAEAAFKHSHDLMRYVIEHTRSAIAVHDRDLKYLYVSQRYLQDYKVKEKDVIGKHHYEVFPDLPQKWRDVHQKALAGEVSSAEDDPYVREDGSVDWTRWECRPWYEVDGSIGGIIVYTEVITERKRVEEALRESETKHKSMIANISDVIAIMAGDGTLRYKSPNIEKWFGWQPEDLVGTNGWDTVHPDDMERIQKEIAMLLEKDNAEKTMEYRYQCKDGSYKVIELTAVNLSHNPNIQGVLMNYHDITERKQAEAAIYDLKARIGEQERYSVLVELASDGFWLLDKQFLTVFVNPALEEMLGYAKEEMIGRSWYDFGDPDWVARARELEKRRKEGVREPHDFLFIHKKGRKVLTRIAATPIYDQDGNFNGALGILSDITRQKEAEEALKIRDMLNSIANSSGIGMCLINPDYTIAWYNDLHAQWFGPLDGTKGRNCFEVFEGRAAICPGCPTQETFETGDVVRIERTGITTSAGADRIMAVSTSPIRDSGGKVIQVVEIVQDITERVRVGEEIRQLNSELEQRIADRTAQLTAANQELEAFSYSVSHDLRAPLRSLDGFSAALLEDYAGQLDEQGQNHLARIQEASRRMGQLINDLLGLSRVTRADFTHQQVDMSGLANSIAVELKAQSPNRQVEFQITADMIVQGDGNLLKIVLENLLNNAYKFTSQRQQAIIQVGMVEQEQQRIYFCTR